jgi:Flp pilus assembly protein TadG
MVLAFGSILLLMSLGVVEFGKLVYWSIEISNAAKAGAQYGAQTSATANEVTPIGIPNAAAAAAPDLSILSSFTTTSSLSCVCTTTGAYSSYSASTGCSAVTCSGTVNDAVTVNTSVTVTPPYRLTGFGTSYTLTGSATQECVQ